MFVKLIIQYTMIQGPNFYIYMFVCDFYSYFLGIASEVMLKKIVSLILTNESDNPEEKRMCVCQKKYVLFSCCFCQKRQIFSLYYDYETFFNRPNIKNIWHSQTFNNVKSDFAYLSLSFESLHSEQILLLEDN